MGLRFVPVPPVSAALRSLAVCLTVGAAIGCAGSGKGGPSGGGGSAAGGKTGSGGAAAGTTGSGTAGTSGAAGTTGSGGATGVAGAGGGNVTGTAGTGTTGAAGTGSGSAGTTGVAGTTGSGGTTSVVDAATSDAACQSASYTFAPKIPSVLILVDRSGSVFDSATTGTFFTLRTAVEAVVAQLGSQVRFGVASFVGDHSSGSCALNYQSVPIAPDNAAAIKTAYDGWGPLLPYGSTADTPAVEAIPMVKAALQADSGTGQKYMMVVTDSETDFCDNGNPLCPADAVTYMIQDMYSSTPSIGTLVIGLPTTLNSIGAAVLKDFANAGAGQGVLVPAGSGATTATDVYNQCNGTGTAAGSDSWSSLHAAAGRTASQPLATYSATGGTATVFSPGSTSETDLENAISAAISGVKSCTFDLSDVGGRSIKVDTTKLAQAHVTIEGATIPLDATNGWTVNASAPSTLLLNGTACTTWRMPTNNNIDFAFPCSTIIFE